MQFLYYNPELGLKFIKQFLATKQLLSVATRVK